MGSISHSFGFGAFDRSVRTRTPMSGLSLFLSANPALSLAVSGAAARFSFPGARRPRAPLAQEILQFSARWISFSRKRAPVWVARRCLVGCRMKGGSSDIISDLELGKPEGKRQPDKRVNGIFWILLLNIGIYVADHVFQVRGIKTLYLYHSQPAWYQFVTATFCHANWNHLSSNLFFLYIFGKLVEEEEGNFALWISYLLTGVGANLVSWLVLPRFSISIGASGAVFGLFAISVLVKLSWDWRKILEVLILGQFVIDKVMEAAQASTGLVGPLGPGSSLQNVNHIAHLSGALVGVALVLFLSRIPSQPSGPDSKGG